MMREIPAGQTWSYAAAGDQGGRSAPCAPPAPRVPATSSRRSYRATASCGQDGSLGGYYYGLDVKHWLLAHEGGELAG